MLGVRNLCFVSAAAVVTMLMLTAVTVRTVSAKPLDLYDDMLEDERLILRVAEMLSDIATTSVEDEVRPSGSVNSIENSPASERCSLPQRRGLCRALLPRWRYDPVAKDCIEFKFGGCDGNANNFMSHTQCMESCKGI